MKKNKSDLNLWKNVWRTKGKEASEKAELKDLMNIDGWFHTAAGDLSINTWLSFIKEIQERLKIKETKILLEVGCGAGASLFPMYNSNIKVFGIDYSCSLIKLCTKIMPFGIFTVSEAETLPFKDYFFDAIICNSVFQYFESINYAENVVNEMARVLKSTGNIAILDINDSSKKYEFESIRKLKLGNKEYDRLYDNLPHQFYKKEWFKTIANRLNVKCDIEDQNIIGYKNSKFRFNVFLSKEGMGSNLD